MKENRNNMNEWLMSLCICVRCIHTQQTEYTWTPFNAFDEPQPHSQSILTLCAIESNQIESSIHCFFTLCYNEVALHNTHTHALVNATCVRSGRRRSHFWIWAAYNKHAAWVIFFMRWIGMCVWVPMPPSLSLDISIDDPVRMCVCRTTTKSSKNRETWKKNNQKTKARREQKQTSTNRNAFATQSHTQCT